MIELELQDQTVSVVLTFSYTIERELCIWLTRTQDHKVCAIAVMVCILMSQDSASWQLICIECKLFFK